MLRVRQPQFLYFNPRSHERSDQGTKLFKMLLYNFNPRSHERSDYLSIGNLHSIAISIHAPTRGATYLATAVLPFAVCISIHAPTRGATMQMLPLSDRLCHFNPRSHERSDNYLINSQVFYLLFQSTLPREERPCSSISKIIKACIFQSTLPREERRITQQENTAREEFQSTLPREERRVLVSIKSRNIYNFNPRSHERSDVFWSPSNPEISIISIHAPTRGATFSSFLNKVISHFNPRSHERSDVYIDSNPTALTISIHAPTRGATAVPFQVPLSLVFQSTLPREERRLFAPLLHFHYNFNPRSHERSDEAVSGGGRPEKSFQSTLPREERP